MNARPDVISPVQRDHREIEQMLLRVEDATRSERSDAFSVLVDKLKRPEARGATKERACPRSINDQRRPRAMAKSPGTTGK